MDEAVIYGIIGIASKTPVYDRGWLVAGRNALRHRSILDKSCSIYAVRWWHLVMSDKNCIREVALFI